MTYNEFEQAVYKWLMAKNELDNNFTFSTRKKANKGSEKDYFIGTEKSKYFGTTLWTIPSSYPGSSADCINIIFKKNSGRYSYYIETNQTNTPEGSQNKSVLQLLEGLVIEVEKEFDFDLKPSKDKKMFYSILKPRHSSYQSLEELFIDLDNDLKNFVPIVDNQIELQKKSNSEFKAHRITKAEFEAMQISLEKRIKRYSHLARQNNRIKRKAHNYKTSKEGWLNLKSDKKITNPYDDGDPMAPEFLKIKKGDFIIANSGDLEVFAFGVAVSEVKDTEIEVDWLIEGIVQYKSDFIPGRKDLLRWTNVNRISNESLEYIVQSYMHMNEENIDTLNDLGFEYQSDYFAKMNNLKQSNTTKPTNKILYGPPGTGKTYSTINEAISIIEPDFDLTKKRPDIVSKYNELVASGQIVFTTFHQSMSYEDFIEGIKPVTREESIFYEVKNGLFKEFCFQESTLKVGDKLGNYKLVEIGEDDYWVSKPNGGEMPINKRVIEDLLRYMSINELTEFNDDVNVSNANRNDFKYLEPYLINGYKSVFTQIVGKIREKSRQLKPKVFIIDEINRGNVSAIFGELITLIEIDKRKGMPNELEVTLPYSNEKFSVPQNVHIIGTMNTADRSVEALDTALRRRFTFEEVMPNPEELKDNNVAGIYLKELLATINKRVEALIDRDHTIGHSYFFNVATVNELRKAFANSIIPLLQEYFYGDYGKIGLVLGNGFVTENKPASGEALFADFKHDSKHEFVQSSYELIPITNDFDIVAAVNTLLNKSAAQSE